MSMIKNQYCQRHYEPLQTPTECVKCLLERLGRQPITLQDLEKIKYQICKVKEDEYSRNIEILKDINSKLLQSKNNYSQKIDKLVSNIGVWVSSIESTIQKAYDLVSKNNTQDYDNLIIEANDHYDVSNHFRHQNVIKSLIQSVPETSLINNCLHLFNSLLFKCISHQNLLQNTQQQIGRQFNLLCRSHQSQAKYIALNDESNNILCEQCFGDQPNKGQQYLTINDARIKWSECAIKTQANLNKNKENFAQDISLINEYFINIRTNCTQQIDRSCQFLLDVETKLQTQLQHKSKLLQKEWNDLNSDEIDQAIKCLSQLQNQIDHRRDFVLIFEQHEDQISKMLEESHKELRGSLRSSFEKIRDKISIRTSRISKLIRTCSLGNSILNSKSYWQYQLMQDVAFTKQDQKCHAITFDNDKRLMMVGCNEKIKVFSFTLGKILLLQTLEKHQDPVWCLEFLKQTNQFLSGSYDRLICLWGLNAKNQWYLKQTLNGHSGFISCLIINREENLLISSSGDKTIRFWKKKNEWEQVQVLPDHTGQIQSLSLNESENTLISCCKDFTILISKIDYKNNLWSVVQRIKPEKYGIGLCFLSSNLFSFQPFDKDKIIIYQFNAVSEKFEPVTEIQIGPGDVKDVLSQPRFIKSKQLLAQKNGNFLNIFRNMENNEFRLEQSIDFQTFQFWGTLTPDGEYLVTWDDITKEFRIRKLHQ